MNKTLIPGNPRLNAKTKEAGKLATASEMANAGFADAALAQGIATQTQGQNGQNSQANKRVPGETAYVNPPGGNIPPLPPRNAEAERQRQASRTKDNIVSTKTKPSDLGISDIEAEALDVSTLKKKDGERDTDENNTDPKSEKAISEEEMNNEFFENLNQQIPNLDMDSGKFKRVKDALHDAGFKLSNSDVITLFSCNFKVSFPWGPIAMNISKGLTEITGTMIALFFTVVGLGATAVGSLVLPILGTLVGGTVSTIGLAIGLMVFFMGIIIIIIGMFLKYRYVHNASDAIQKIGFLRRIMYRYFVKRVWFWFFGALIPLAGWLLNIIVNILTWRYIKKVVGRLKKIVQSTK